MDFCKSLCRAAIVAAAGGQRQAARSKWATELLSEPALSLVTAVVVALVLLTAVVALRVALVSRAKRRRNAVLVIGPSGAGKTVLAHRLCNGTAVETVTSMEPGVLALNDRVGDVQLVDLPGHSALRRTAQTHWPNARAVLFVLDASALGTGPAARSAGELFYATLAETRRASPPVPLLVVCGKQDLLQSWSSDQVRSWLEREVPLVHAAKLAAVAQLADASVTDGLLPLDNGVFSFSQHARNVDLLDVHAGNHAKVPISGISELRAWVLSR